MSTDIYMACDKCKSAIWVGQTGMSGFTFYSGEPKCMKALGDWMRNHYLCGDNGQGYPHIDFEGYVDEDDGWTREMWK
jgi:hypothetical protein